MDTKTINRINTFSIVFAGFSIFLAIWASVEEKRSEQELAMAIKKQA